MVKIDEEGIAIPFTIEGYPFSCRNCDMKGHMEEDDEIVAHGRSSNGSITLMVICPKCAYQQDVLIDRKSMSVERQLGFDRWIQDRFY